MNNILVISTIPHYLVIFLVPIPFYNVIVFLSASLSILWHYNNDKATSLLGILDHLFALFWFICDIYYFTNTPYLQTVLALNICCALVNYLVEQLHRRQIINYKYGHSVWHLLSISKCIYIGNLINYIII